VVAPETVANGDGDSDEEEGAGPGDAGEELNVSDGEGEEPEIEMNWNIMHFLPTAAACQTNFNVSMRIFQNLIARVKFSQ